MLVISQNYRLQISIHCCYCLFFSVPAYVAPLGVADGNASVSYKGQPNDMLRFGRGGIKVTTKGDISVYLLKPKVLTGIKVKGSKDVGKKLESWSISVLYDEYFPGLSTVANELVDSRLKVCVLS